MRRGGFSGAAPPSPMHSLTRLCAVLSLSVPAALAAQGHAPAGPSASPHRFGRFDLELKLPALAVRPELAACAQQLQELSGHADCAVPADVDHVSRAQLAWDDAREGGSSLIALRLSFDPATAPALTDLEWQLTRAWGAPTLEQLRREKGHKLFTLQWEDAERRATLEAGAPVTQPSRVFSLTLERKQPPQPGELSTLRPKPFAGFHVRWMKRLEWESSPYAVVYGTSLSPAQEALGESGPGWSSQRNYVGIWRLDPAAGERRKRWRPLWDRVTGGEDEEDPQRVLRIATKDVTGDGAPDVAVEFSCDSCGRTANEVVLKTLRAGKLVDLLVKRDLFRATVEMENGRVRIREPEDREDGRPSATVSTYAYDRSKGAFVLAREEHVED